MYGITSNKKVKKIVGILPKIHNYNIEKCYYFKDNIQITKCNNCGKLILNICVIKDTTDNKLYNVGLDCASTLQNINRNELEKFNNIFNEAKSQRNRILRAIKERNDLKHTLELYNGNMNTVNKYNDSNPLLKNIKHDGINGFILYRYYNGIKQRHCYISYYDNQDNNNMWSNVIYPYLKDLEGDHNLN